MGKDKVEKKDRAEKKEKRAEKDGVHKVKKEKKEKKDKTALVDAVEKEIGSEAMEGLEQTGDVAVKGEGEVDAVVDRPTGAVVPFANPLVEDKQAKKVLKSVKKAAVNKSLKRGVKEVVKALRKSPIPAANAPIGVPNGDHGIPYVFVTSRAELGASAATKRPTSVVMVTPKAAKGKKDDDEEFTKVFEELAGLTQKELKKLTV
ncbi:unnamed protein product [Penicillium nalgiovense]|nr:unnamed protein product [Penicillium nalgiovense]